MEESFGFVAVIRYSNGKLEVVGCFKTRNEAKKEASKWAEDEGMKYAITVHPVDSPES